MNAIRAITLTLLAFAALLVGTVSPVAAQGPKSATFTAKVEPMPARVGEVVKVTVTASIKEPFHIYSAVPSSASPGPQPTVLTVEGSGLTPVGGVIESTPISKLDKNFKSPNAPDGLQVGLHEKS